MKTNQYTNDRLRFFRKSLRLASPLMAAAVLLTLTGCETNRQVTDYDYSQESGFLVDYSKMQRGLPDRASLFYEAPDANFAKYTKIWIKPIELWNSGDPDSPMGQVSSEDQQKLVDLLDTALTTALSTNYTMVSEGGPDVLIIHAAITDARKSKPVLGVISSVYLPLKLISLGKQSLYGTGIGVGSVTIEAEFLDGATNERLVAVLDTRSGTTALRGRFQNSWGDVENSFNWWADRLATRLQEEKAGAANKTAL